MAARATGPEVCRSKQCRSVIAKGCHHTTVAPIGRAECGEAAARALMATIRASRLCASSPGCRDASGSGRYAGFAGVRCAAAGWRSCQIRRETGSESRARAGGDFHIRRIRSPVSNFGQPGSPVVANAMKAQRISADRGAKSGGTGEPMRSAPRGPRGVSKVKGTSRPWQARSAPSRARGWTPPGEFVARARRGTAPATGPPRPGPRRRRGGAGPVRIGCLRRRRMSRTRHRLSPAVSVHCALPSQPVSISPGGSAQAAAAACRIRAAAAAPGSSTPRATSPT